MSKVAFFLKEPKAQQPTLLYLIYQYRGQKLKYSFGQKIHPDFWNSSIYRAKETRKFPEYAEFNSLLANIETCVNNTYRRLINDNEEPTTEKLKAALNAFLQVDKADKAKKLLPFIENYIETSNRKLNTKKQYRTAFTQLKRYTEKRKVKIDFKDINLEFYADFFKYLIEQDYSVNSIGTIVKNIKVFMNEAVERGLTDNLQFKSKRFKTIEEDTDAIYLSMRELKELEALDLSDNTRLDKVRDLFLIGCYTGLRFSDLVQLRDENLIANNTQVKIRTEKTGAVVIIPLTSAVKNILIKYNGIPPQTISNQKMNQYLKELGQKANINEEILITSTKGGERHKETFKKHELVTVHTARRSFATNAYLNGVPTISIMKITGHRTEKAFMKYIKISQEDNANKLLNHPFFM